MKVPFKKPGYEYRQLKDMKKIKYGKFAGITFVYPEGTPMRRYKDAKKALKYGK